MATPTASKNLAPNPYGRDVEAQETSWDGLKLAILGIVTLAIALFILYSISP